MGQAAQRPGHTPQLSRKFTTALAATFARPGTARPWRQPGPFRQQVWRQGDDEVLSTCGRNGSGELTRVRTPPEGVGAINYAFDVTPAELIAGIITERRIIKATPGDIERVVGRRG